MTFDTTVVDEDIANKPIKACVYIPQYMFRACTIKTCKNYTAITSSRCLAIDRVQPIGNKIISDSELHLFKFSEAGVTSRLISIKRKKAVFRVKAILVLYSYLQYIKEHYKPTGELFRGKHIEKAEVSYPLKVRKLGFRNWMWRFMVDPEVYAKFTKKKEGECSTFKVHMLLDVTAMKFENLLAQIPTARSRIKLKSASAVLNSTPSVHKSKRKLKNV